MRSTPTHRHWSTDDWATDAIADSSPPGLIVFSMTEIVPEWAVRLDGSSSHGPDLERGGGACVVLMDAALLEEHDLEWIEGVERDLGPVIVVEPAGSDGRRARSRGARGSVPRSILTAPGPLALDILSDLIAESAASPCQMERYMRDAIHEFRTPLTVISEFAGLCEDGIGGPLTERQSMYLGYIQGAVDRMGEQFDDFRDGVQMRFGSLQHGADRGFLAEVVRAAAAAMGEENVDTAAVAGVRLDGVDCGRLTEALKRVLAGAAKLSAKGETLTVSAVLGPGGEAEIWARYRGVAVSDDDIQVMASGTVMGEDGFYRSVARVFGLGVSMARLFLEQSGGRLRLETQEGRGGALVATLPVEIPGEAYGERSGAA